MAVPTTKAEFAEWCLRALGKPVIQINVSDEQVDDRIDQALRFFWDYHVDGTEKTFYKYQIKQEDVDNGYVPVPTNIVGVINIFDVGAGVNTNNLFNIRYQIALNDLYTLTSQSMVPYYMAMQHIQTLEQLLVGKQPIRYNRMNDKLYIDMDWHKVNVGEYLLAEAYGIIDPTTYPKVWGDRWLQRYATALIKQQWGGNLIKFMDMQLPGGVKFNAEKIYNDATAQIASLEEEMYKNYSGVLTDMIG